MTIIDSDYRRDFLDGALTALLWANLWDTDGEFIEDGIGREDQVTPESRARLSAECAEFIDANTADLIAQGDLYVNPPWTPGELAGHDFTLTRNGHGAGFWDRGTGEVGDRLADAARAYRDINAYVLGPDDFGEAGTIVIE